MATISSPGIGSGLDINAIVSQLMAVERAPLVQLERQESQLSAKLSEFGKFQSLVSALRDKAAALNGTPLWTRTVGTSADAAVTVSTGSNAVAGRYAVQVQQLAASQAVASRRFTTADPGSFGAGSLTVELGTYGGEPATSFTPKEGAAIATITFTADDDTLAEVRDRINGAGAGVVASIIRDAGGERLAIRSAETGADNGFRLVGSDGAAELSFSALAASPMTLAQRAASASATIDGIAVESRSNTLADVADGITLTLQRVTAQPVEVTVASDRAAVKTAIDDFVKAYNELASFIRTQTRYDEANRKAGPMQGDSLVLAVQRRMRAVLAEPSTATARFDRLSSIGITLQQDGTLAVDAGRLDNGLADPAELRRLMATAGTASADSGFMRRFQQLGDALLGSDGSLGARTQSLRTSIDRLDDRQAQLQARLEATERRLRAQYTALDKNLGQLNGLSGAVGQQLQALNNFYTARSNGN